MLNFGVVSFWFLFIHWGGPSLFARGRWCWVSTWVLCLPAPRGQSPSFPSSKWFNLLQKDKAVPDRSGLCRLSLQRAALGLSSLVFGPVNSILVMCLGKLSVSERETGHCCQLPDSPCHGLHPPGSSVGPIDTSVRCHVLCASSSAQGATLIWYSYKT